MTLLYEFVNQEYKEFYAQLGLKEKHSIVLDSIDLKNKEWGNTPYKDLERAQEMTKQVDRHLQICHMMINTLEEFLQHS